MASFFGAFPHLLCLRYIPVKHLYKVTNRGDLGIRRVPTKTGTASVIVFQRCCSLHFLQIQAYRVRTIQLAPTNALNRSPDALRHLVGVISET